jgi:hypothetical protein
MHIAQYAVASQHMLCNTTSTTSCCSFVVKIILQDRSCVLATVTHLSLPPSSSPSAPVSAISQALSHTLSVLPAAAEDQCRQAIAVTRHYPCHMLHEPSVEQEGVGCSRVAADVHSQRHWPVAVREGEGSGSLKEGPYVTHIGHSGAEPYQPHAGCWQACCLDVRQPSQHLCVVSDV